MQGFIAGMVSLEGEGEDVLVSVKLAIAGSLKI
jgi:hypothetical protein